MARTRAILYLNSEAWRCASRESGGAFGDVKRRWRLADRRNVAMPTMAPPDKKTDCQGKVRISKLRHTHVERRKSAQKACAVYG